MTWTFWPGVLVGMPIGAIVWTSWVLLEINREEREAQYRRMRADD